MSHLWLNNSLQVCGGGREREATLRASLRHVGAHGLGRSLEAAVNFMLAEVMIEIGRWDEAAELLDSNLQHGVTGMTRYFTCALRARLAAFRGEQEALAAAVDGASDLARAPSQQPIPQAIARLAEAGSGSTAPGMEFAHEAQELAKADAYYRAEALALLARAEADAAWAARTRAYGVDPKGSRGLLRRASEWDARANAQTHALMVTVIAEVDRKSGRRDPQPWREAVDAWRGRWNRPSRRSRRRRGSRLGRGWTRPPAPGSRWSLA